MSGTVSVVKSLGNTADVHLDSPAGQLVVVGDPGVRVDPGMVAGVRLNPDRANVFDHQGIALPLAAQAF